MNKGKRKGSTFLPAGSGNGLTGTGTMWKPHEGALRVHDWTWGEHCGCCGSTLSLVQIFFSFVLGTIMYDNNMIISLKQKKRKFEPRIKLNHNMDTITHYHHHHHHHHYHRQHHHHNHFYRAYSLTWPASMLIFTNKRKFVHKKRVQFPQGCLAIQTWPPFHCFGTPIWPPWRHANTLYSLLISLYIKRFHVDAKFYGKQGILWTE